MKDITNEQRLKIDKKKKSMEMIFILDGLEAGDSVFIGKDEVNNIRSLYLAMYRRGKKFRQSTEIAGWILTRCS